MTCSPWAARRSTCSRTSTTLQQLEAQAPELGIGRTAVGGWPHSGGKSKYETTLQGARTAAAQPFGGLIDPREAARAVAFLSRKESGLSTGCVVDSDQSIWAPTRLRRSCRRRSYACR